MAWRNVWRNPKRTLVIMTAVVIGVWSMVLLGALMQGMAANMVKNGIATLTGHLKIQDQSHRADPVIQNSLKNPESIYKILKPNLPRGSLWVKRIKVNAIAANAHTTSGVTLVGVEPQKEARISFYGQPPSQGRSIEPVEKHGIYVGQALLEKFGTKLSRKLVLMSQDKKGNIASRAFRIKGVFRAELEVTEKRYVFISLAAAQSMLEMKNEISEISILLPNKEQGQKVAAKLKPLLPKGVQVLTWQELLPLLTTYLKMMGTFTAIWHLVVFIAMAFGIVNTSLMAVMERIREFGLFKALGMPPFRIVTQVMMESGIILLIGMVLGSGLGMLSVFALANTGIDLSSLAEAQQYLKMTRVIYPALNPQDLIGANAVVLFLGLLVSTFSAVKAARITAREAMSHI
jgi:ABC-type lipoprotein release transport system permease subunit